ncbi:MAG: hypothetical protein O3A00_21085, partial [Planctomycetota bacterium]|nr:hypothetical protein [Planctomycetota bacterium]
MSTSPRTVLRERTKFRPINTTPLALALVVLGLALCAGGGPAIAADVPVITAVERQPFGSATKRLVEALTYVGSPLPAADAKELDAALAGTKPIESIKRIQTVLDKHCVAFVHINAESRVKVAEGAAKKELVQQGWRTFLVKVHNEAGITAQLKPESPNALPVYQRGSGTRQRPQTAQKLVSAAD